MGKMALTRHYSLPKRKVSASTELTKLINTLFYLLTKFITDEESTKETTTMGTTEGVTTAKPTEVTKTTTESVKATCKSYTVQIIVDCISKRQVTNQNST